jgi:general secretion pathway protein D
MLSIQTYRPQMFIVLLLCLSFLYAPAKVMAIENIPPSMLEVLSVPEMSKSSAKIVLTFSKRLPKYSIINNDSDAPAIAFPLTTASQNVKSYNALKGFLKSVDVKQSDKLLLINFATLGQSQINVIPVNDNSITISIESSDKNKVEAFNKPLPKTVLTNKKITSDDNDIFEVVLLKYADISEVVGLLTGATIRSNDNFTVYEPSFGSAGLTGNSYYNPQPGRGPDSLNQSMAETVNDEISVDRRLNAIILRGSKTSIALLKAKITAVDIPVESVILETIFVELTDSAAKNVGLDFNNANGSIAVASYQTGADVTALSLLDQPDGTRRSYLKSSALQAAIYAQVTQGNGRIVSKPRISAQSGSTAKIITGDALPILTTVIGNNTNFAGQQVQYVNVGVTLQIAPRVSDDGFVTSHIFCVVSSVTGYTTSSNSNYPKISQREAETSATVADGDTFVIGGLTQENELNSNARVPILGDIPLVGKLFQRDNNSRNKTQLYIVVTPHITKKGDLVDAAVLNNITN